MPKPFQSTASSASPAPGGCGKSPIGKSPTAVWFILVFSATLLVAGAAPGGSDEADPRQAPQFVKTAIARPADPGGRVFTGVVSARVQSALGFRVPGKVNERLVDVGQSVRAGQPLLRLDNKDLDLALQAKDNAAASARATAVQTAADEARYASLIAKGWSTRQRYEQAKAAFDSASAQLAAAEAQAAIARNERGYAALVADADGVIVEILAEPGTVVAAGQTVARLAHAGPREAAVNLPEAVRPAIGSTARAQLYGAAGDPSTARLRQLADAADPASRTFEARYALDGAASLAPLGATVTIALDAAAAEAAAEIPLGALYDTGAATGVWIVDPAASVAFRPVAIRRLTAETAIVAGVEPGERVVALGAHLLRAGDRIRYGEGSLALQ